MKPQRLLLTFLLAGLTTAGGWALNTRAAGPDDLKADAQELMERARSLKAEGRMEESEQAAIKAKELLQQARDRSDAAGEQGLRPEVASPGGQPTMRRRGAEGRDEIVREYREVRRERRDDRRLEGERTLRPLREFGSEARGQALHGPEAQARLEHLQQAIGHLHAAGLHQAAERLEREAERLRQRFEPRREGMLTPTRSGPQPSQRELDALQSQIVELRERMADLQRAMDKTREAFKRHLDEDRR